MAKSRNRRTAYLTKRRLISAAREGVRKAAEETMQDLGYTIIARNGWIVKKLQNGTIQRISKIQSAGKVNELID